MASQTGDLKALVPENLREAKLKPGDVSLVGFERKDDVFTVTFRWCDMIGGEHEHAFDRGDIFADFNKVLKILTDGGLPVDLTKTSEFQSRLCQLSTVMLKQEEKPAAKAPAAKKAK